MHSQIPPETHETRTRRLRMRSWRRGIKEMDMILGPFADRGFLGLSDGDWDVYEAILAENDQDLYQWFSGQITPPNQYIALIDLIMAAHRQI